ncbi:hypothetical protein K458DRAFT_289308 [Lentithecium fluviatile CBS 122367]|uniref:C3H1-type domain-containing protein n=1 Tax=Lentithecium fluviatile CBS 122367 TaxID=1168545 RepID=A0A6G1JHK3_9PLEO|nr:hypothetical protein K458DRAFT_289308 [Lentithecium fluviatile CBS 122367]
MAPSHVPSEHLPLQGQNIYTDPTYENLFPVHQYGPQTWSSGQLNHPGLGPDSSANQTWHHNTYPQQPFNQISQPYANQTHGHRTASPYQYGQFSNHGSVGSYGQGVNVDPALGVDPIAMRQTQQSPYQMNVQNAPSQTQTNTVTPQALQQGLAVQNPRPVASSYQIPKTTAEIFAQRAPPTFAKPVKIPEYDIPKGRKSGGFVIFDQAALAKATKSSALNKLVTFGSEPFHLASNRTALPLYTPRQSVKELKKAGAGNKKLITKKTSTKLLSSGKTLKQDVSDSESYDDSSDDESEYSDDEEAEPSPLPAARPDEMHGATQYDMIKAAWFPRKSQPSSEKIKASLRDVWEIFNTIQKRWRIDSKAVTEAEEQKKTKELPVLKSRVTSSRDLLQSALQAALDYAHPDVLYHIGQVKPFLYLCYQFLANRFKAQDYDGKLSTAIYGILARCVGTLTTELLEETKVIKALNSMKKNVSEKNKALIQQIVEGAATGSKKAKVSSPPEEITVEQKVTKRPATQPASRSSAEPSTTKKLKLTEPLSNGEKRPAVTTTAPRPSPAPGAAQQKRPGERAALAPAKPRGTQVVNKPSSLFASLNAASKKPASGSTSLPTAKSATKPAATAKDKKPTPALAAKPAFSFAETMAQLMKPKEEEVAAPAKSEKQLPPETTAEKAKRLRKESRRHLRVAFKPDSSLVHIKYFHHDPEEESGHDENFVRDAGDIGGEGRMFKQHKEMMDEDDDEEMEVVYRPWKEPSLVDFSRIDPNDQKLNYEPYGGGERKPECPEKEANIRHETSTLMVFYSHPSDIPSSPREPLEQQTQPSASAPVISFGPPPDLVLSRAPKAPMPAPVPDLSNLENIFKQFAGSSVDPMQASAPAATYPTSISYAPAMAPAAPAPAPVPDLASILSALNQGQTQAPAPAPAPATFPPAPQATGAPTVDLSAIMAALSAGNTAFAAPPPPPGWPALPLAFPQPPTDNAAGYQHQSQSQPEQQTRGGHKRQREVNHDNDHAKGHGSNKRNKFDRNHKPHKIIPCRFFSKGMCNKGDDCTYIHDLNG